MPRHIDAIWLKTDAWCMPADVSSLAHCGARSLRGLMRFAYVYHCRATSPDIVLLKISFYSPPKLPAYRILLPWLDLGKHQIIHLAACNSFNSGDFRLRHQ